MKIPVINLSLSGPANPLLEAMAAHVSAKGHILVAAVGNEGPHAAPQFPAAYENVVGVTAVDQQDRVYLYANQGDYVDFAASGVDTSVAKSSGDVSMMPDEILLFREPILLEWIETGEDLFRLVRNVLIHEIGHHFGLSDDDIDRLEGEG